LQNEALSSSEMLVTSYQTRKNGYAASEGGNHYRFILNICA